MHACVFFLFLFFLLGILFDILVVLQNKMAVVFTKVFEMQISSLRQH